MARFIQVAPNYRIRYEFADPLFQQRANRGELNIVSDEGTAAVPTQSKAPFSIATSETGEEILQKTEGTETRLRGQPRTITAAPQVPQPKETGFAEFGKADTEQTQKIPLANLTPEKVKSLAAQGYQFFGGEGNIPSFVTGAQKLGQLQQDLDSAQQELEKAKKMLTDFSVEGDPEFQRQIEVTSRTYDRRADLIQERANKNERANKFALTSARSFAVTSGRFSASGRAIPGLVQSVISENERKIIKSMQELQEDRKTALLKARERFEAGKWSEYVDLVKIAEDSYNKQLDRYLDLQKEVDKQNEEYEKENRKLQIQSDIFDAFSAGATTAGEIYEVLDQSVDLKTIEDNLKILAKETTGLDEEEEAITKLQGMERNYYLLKQLGGLPPEVTNQPENQQLGAYLRWHRDQSLKPPTSPKEPKGPTLSLAEVSEYNLPYSLIGESERSIFMQLQNPNPAPWFREKAYMDARMPLRPEILQKMWDDFREKALSSEEDESDFTNQERRKLEQADLLGADRQEQLDYLYGETKESKFVKDLRVYLESAADAGRERADVEKQLKKKYGKNLPVSILGLLDELWPS